MHFDLQGLIQTVLLLASLLAIGTRNANKITALEVELKHVINELTALKSEYARLLDLLIARGIKPKPLQRTKPDGRAQAHQ